MINLQIPILSFQNLIVFSPKSSKFSSWNSSQLYSHSTFTSCELFRNFHRVKNSMKLYYAKCRITQIYPFDELAITIEFFYFCFWHITKFRPLTFEGLTSLKATFFLLKDSWIYKVYPYSKSISHEICENQKSFDLMASLQKIFHKQISNENTSSLILIMININKFLKILRAIFD